MGVAVLPPQDFLRNHHHNPNKPRPNPNPNPNTVRSSRRRRNSPPPRPNTPPVMGPIRILKRDEDLSPPAQPKPKPGPMPDGFYAGSAFVTSPPPSSLPLPAFFTGRRNCGMCEARDPVAETVLRRALKLQ